MWRPETGLQNWKPKPSAVANVRDAATGEQTRDVELNNIKAETETQETRYVTSVNKQTFGTFHHMEEKDRIRAVPRR